MQETSRTSEFLSASCLDNIFIFLGNVLVPHRRWFFRQNLSPLWGNSGKAPLILLLHSAVKSYLEWILFEDVVRFANSIASPRTNFIMVQIYVALVCFVAATAVNAFPRPQPKPSFNWDDTNFL